MLRLIPLLLLLLVCCSSATGCLGPLALRHSRAKYNEAIQRTADEQLLLNLVRLRYRDTPSFMELSSLSTQFAFSEGAFANGGFVERATTPDVLDLGFSFDASERPTVTYDPLRGQQFVRRLVSPLSEETIILLIRSGWSIDRVLRLTAQELNGAENVRRASGPTPATISQHEFLEFRRAVNALREMQVARETTIGYEDTQKALSGPLDRQLLDADAIVEAAKEGWRIEPRHERLMLAVSKIKSGSQAVEHYKDKKLLETFQEQMESQKKRTPLRVRFDPDDEEHPFTVASGDFGDLRLLAYQEYLAERGNPEMLVPVIVEYPNEFVVNGPTQSLILSWNPTSPNQQKIKAQLAQLPAPPPPKAGRYDLEIEPRSLMGTLYYLSHSIRVPAEHEAAGLTTVTINEFGEGFDWAQLTGDLLLVQSSPRRPPCAAVAVPYRGYWFYVDDRDLNSKATFALLMQLFELQAGGGATGTKPVLTLPVGA